MNVIGIRLTQMNMVFYAHFTQIGMRSLHSIEYGFVQIYISVDTSLANVKELVPTTEW